MQKIQHYVLFPNHDNGMRLYGILKEAGIKATIAPTPRAASKCCASHCSSEKRIWKRSGNLSTRIILRF